MQLTNVVGAIVCQNVIIDIWAMLKKSLDVIVIFYKLIKKSVFDIEMLLAICCVSSDCACCVQENNRTCVY